MKPIYHWNEREVPMIPGVNANEIIILSCDGHNASGSVSFIDYWEHGIAGEERWIAVLLGNTWMVSKATVPGEEELFADCDTGEPQFTLSRPVNTALKAFIALHVNAYLAGKKIGLAPKYSGPLHKYAGPCLCAELAASTPAAPFDWEKHTEGGMFPFNCFECGCGARWHCIDPKTYRWLKVAEAEAWHMLTEYNGTATRQLGILDQEIYLLETLCDHGYSLI